MTRRLAVAAALALVLPAAAAARPAPPPAAVIVTTSFLPPTVFFGDHVVARVDVLVDRRRVDAASVAVAVDFGKWEQLGSTRTALRETRATARRTDLYTLVCLSLACVPRGQILQPVVLPPVRVRARALDGSPIAIQQPWTSLEVAGRFLPPVTGGVRPVLRGLTDAPAATFRLPPGRLSLALDVVGALLLAAALALAARETVPWWLARRRSLDTRPPLVRALELVREAQDRGVDDRRRAAALLARLLPDHDVGRDAAAVAWSRADPPPEALERLAQQAEAVAAGERG